MNFQKWELFSGSPGMPIIVGKKTQGHQVSTMNGTYSVNLFVFTSNLARLASMEDFLFRFSYGLAKEQMQLKRKNHSMQQWYDI